MKQEMKIYKSIIRFDFKLSYRLIDSLGEFLELMQKELKAEYQNTNGQVDIIQHAIHSTADGENEFLILNMNPNSYDIVIEFKNGIEFSSLSRNNCFAVFQKLLDKLQYHGTEIFERIGFRSWILCSGEDLFAEKIKEFLWHKNSIFENSINMVPIKKDDIAIVHELTLNNEQLRINWGPYTKKELTKFFGIEIPVTEGMIIDIDIWQSKINLSQFNVIEVLRKNQKIYANIAEELINYITGGSK